LQTGDIVKAINGDASFAYMPVGTVVKRLTPVDGAPRVATTFTILRNAKNKVITSAEIQAVQVRQQQRWNQLSEQQQQQQVQKAEQEAERLREIERQNERDAAKQFYRQLRESGQKSDGPASTASTSPAGPPSQNWKQQFEQLANRQQLESSPTSTSQTSPQTPPQLQSWKEKFQKIQQQQQQQQQGTQHQTQSPQHKAAEAPQLRGAAMVGVPSSSMSSQSDVTPHQMQSQPEAKSSPMPPLQKITGKDVRLFMRVIGLEKFESKIVEVRCLT
jgi:hypothetical protein